MSRICVAMTRSRHAWPAGVIGNAGLAAGFAVLILLGSVMLGASTASAAVAPVAPEDGRDQLDPTGRVGSDALLWEW